MLLRHLWSANILPRPFFPCYCFSLSWTFVLIISAETTARLVVTLCSEQTGAHQFKVSPGDLIYTEKLKFCDINDKVSCKIRFRPSKFHSMLTRQLQYLSEVHFDSLTSPRKVLDKDLLVCGCNGDKALSI